MWLDALIFILTSLCLFTLLLISGVWLWYQWTYRELIKTASTIPITGAPAMPLIGHAYKFIPGGVEEILNYLWYNTVETKEKGYKTKCTWIGPIPIIGILDVDDIEILLRGTNSMDKADEYDFLFRGYETGAGPIRKTLLSAGGAEWRAMRKHMNPMFHPRNIERLLPVFNANCRQLVERISHHEGQGPFNVMEYTMPTMLQTVCNLIFGSSITIDVNSKPFNDFKRTIETIPEMFILRLFRPWLRIEFLFRLLYRKKINELTKGFREFTATHLKEFREQQTLRKSKQNIFQLNGHSKTFAEEDEDYVNLFDAYSRLQKNNPNYTEADLLGEILDLCSTGSDTIGPATASCLLALAQHQDIQERLYNEICFVVGLDDDVTLEDLSRMTYLDMVVKETLRRFTIAPFLIRKVTKDTTLSQITMPAGYPIFIVIAAPLMDPEIYPDPKKFDPERFSPKRSSENDKFAFVPFSGGPRICIGKTYSMNLMKIALVHVVRKYKLFTTQSINNLKKKLIVTLISVEGYNISVRSRKPDKSLVENDWNYL